jgi:hypothetical protein
MEEFKFRKIGLEVVRSFKEADDADRKYYWSLTPQQRMSILQHLREINHGDTVGSKLQRVLEFTRAPQR